MRRTAKLIAPAALVATLLPVGAGVLAAGEAPASISGLTLADGDATRAPEVSRDAIRIMPSKAELKRQKSSAATRIAITRASVELWTDADVKVWDGPKKDARRIGTIDEGTQVLVTGRRFGNRAEIVMNDRPLWVPRAHLVEDEPVPPIGTAPCGGSAGSIEAGLQPAAVRVLRAVCNAFPQISTYGGRDNHGEHRNGEAIDIMTSDYALGTAIAEFLIAHASEFGLYDVIWRQRMWQPGNGWTPMSDRGSATANHYDHVHVKVL